MEHENTHKPSSSQNMAYLANALIVSILPVYLYRSVVGMSVPEYGLYYLAVTAVSTILLSTGYHATTLWAFGRLDREREGLLTKTKVDALKKARGVGGTTEEFKAKLLTQQRANSTLEATAFSIALNNVMFFLMLVILGFFVFYRLPVPVGYVVTAVATPKLAQMFIAAFLG